MRVGPNAISYCRKLCQDATECGAGQICLGNECLTPNCTAPEGCPGGVCFGEDCPGDTCAGVCCYVLPPPFNFVCP
jgi:hypothetical protein